MCSPPPPPHLFVSLTMISIAVNEPERRHPTKNRDKPKRSHKHLPHTNARQDKEQGKENNKEKRTRKRESGKWNKEKRTVSKKKMNDKDNSYEKNSIFPIGAFKTEFRPSTALVRSEK